MSTSGEFPDTPKGSPGGIRAAARSIGRAADQFDGVDVGLSGATGALEADWHGWAASSYRSCVTGLSGPVGTAADQFRECEQAVSSYADVLERTQDEVDRLRVQYEDAKAREAAATGRLTTLRMQLADAKPKEVGDITSQMSDQATAATSAGGEAAMILGRANEAIDDLHREGQRQAAVLKGEDIFSAGPLALGSAAPIFGGVLGPSFGIPLGGLNLYNGVITVQHPMQTVAKGPGEWLLGGGPLGGDYKTEPNERDSSNIPGYPGYWAMVNGRSPDALEDDNSLINPVFLATGGLPGLGRGAAFNGARSLATEGTEQAVERTAPSVLRNATVRGADGQIIFKTDDLGRRIYPPPGETTAVVGDARQELDKAGQFLDKLDQSARTVTGDVPIRSKKHAMLEAGRLVAENLARLGGN
jgi:uncharacterized protein YukE